MNIPITSCFPSLIQLGKIMHYKKKTTLLTEGEICQHLFLVEKGVLRLWFNQAGNDISFQFFFEGQIATSYESFRKNLPALYNIETVTEVRLRVISFNELQQWIEQNNQVKAFIDDYILTRLYHYQALFISRIKHSPQQRYEELLTGQPHIFDKIPHHYIASYLGITPVSLSRIRQKTAKS